MTADELVALNLKITEAEAAYHKLQTGEAARVIVDQNGERVEFISANRQQLYLYIQQLKAQLPDSTGYPIARPLRFVF